jgi:hypothetical protein
MKGLLLGATILGAAAVLGGCPTYPDRHNQVCGSDCCYTSDCGPGYACNLQGQCVPWENDAGTNDNACGSCPAGYLCGLAQGVLQCVPSVGPTEDASPPEPGDSSVPVGTTDAGEASAPTPDAATDGRVAAETGTSGGLCNADAQCAGVLGAKCVDGLCTPQGQLCSDGTQCLVAGDSCVDGLCIPRCGASAPPCPTGYACDFNRGVCGVNPGACASSAQCQGGAVCVEARCVAPCASADAGPECPTGQVCVNGGCIPDQQAQFTCKNDGSTGALANTCGPSSICLHGDCYPSCGGEAGTCAGAGESCKSVRIPKGTYAVCAGASQLGSECDPAVGDYCANAGVCVDGYCK